MASGIVIGRSTGDSSMLSLCLTWLAEARSATAAGAATSTPLRELIVEVAVGNRQPHAVQRGTSHRSREEFTADLRQHGVGQDRVDHAAAAFDLGTPADNQLDCLVVVSERDPVVFGHAPGNAPELQP